MAVQNSMKPCSDRLEGAPVVQVVGLDVRDDAGVRGQLQERSVALVGLGDEVGAAAAVRVGPGLFSSLPIAKDGSAPQAAAPWSASRWSWSCRGFPRPRRPGDRASASRQRLGPPEAPGARDGGPPPARGWPPDRGGAPRRDGIGQVVRDRARREHGGPRARSAAEPAGLLGVAAARPARPGPPGSGRCPTSPRRRSPTMCTCPSAACGVALGTCRHRSPPVSWRLTGRLPAPWRTSFASASRCRARRRLPPIRAAARGRRAARSPRPTAGRTSASASATSTPPPALTTGSALSRCSPLPIGNGT